MDNFEDQVLFTYLFIIELLNSQKIYESADSIINLKSYLNMTKIKTTESLSSQTTFLLSIAHAFKT